MAWKLAVGCAAGFVALLLAVALGLTDTIDAALIDALDVPAPPEMLEPLLRVTDLGSSLSVIIVAALVLAAGVVQHHPRDGALGAFVAAHLSARKGVLNRLFASLIFVVAGYMIYRGVGQIIAI